MPGIFLLIALGLSIIFGINTQRTMLFQVFSLLLTFFSISFLSTLFFRPKIELKRSLPEFGVVNKEVFYSILIKNNKAAKESNIKLLEIPEDPRPALQQFLSTPEPDEKKRNKFDQIFCFYRWKWLIQKKSGADFQEIEIPPIEPQSLSTREIKFTPKRRGTIFLNGIRVLHYDLFGLMKSGKTIPATASITILPEIFPISSIRFPGTRKFQKEITAPSSKKGDSMEFASVRPYMHGDPLKHIDWKLFAKHNEPVVRQFLDEYSAHFAIIIDNISPFLWSLPLEKTLSAAASIISSSESMECASGIIYAAKNDFIFSEARNDAERGGILKEVASIEFVDMDFSLFAKYLQSLLPRLSGMIFFFTTIDEARINFVKISKNYHIPAKFILVDEEEKYIAKIEKNNWHGLVEICSGSVPEILERVNL